jgi:hypothetical protein
MRSPYQADDAWTDPVSLFTGPTGCAAAAGCACRFNLRFDLTAMTFHHAGAFLRTAPMAYRSRKLADVPAQAGQRPPAVSVE